MFKSRLLRWLIRLTAAFLLLSTLILSLAIFTPLPDRLAWGTLEKAVRSAGGTVSARREGTLISGVDLLDFDLRVPGKVILRARRIHVRLSPWALVIGVARLKDVKVEGWDLTVTPGPEPSRAEPYRNPRWLRLLVPGFKVMPGKVAVSPTPGAGDAPSTWDGVQAFGNLSVDGQRIRLTLTELSSRCPPPVPPSLTVRGFVAFELGRGGKVDLRLRAGKSKLLAKGRVRLREEKLKDFEGDLLLKGVSLKEILPASDGVPDLVLDGPMALRGDSGGLSWKGDTVARTYGSAASEGTIRWDRGGVSITSTASTPGFDLLPIWNPLPEKRILCRGEGRFSLGIFPGEPIRWEASAKAHNAVFMDVPVGTADLQSRGEGPRATISGPFVTPLTGRSTLAVAWDMGPGTWSVDITGSAANLPEALSNWDIRILSPPPGPLRAPEGKWEVRRATIAGDSDGFFVRGEARDPSGGEVSFEMAPYTGRGPVSWTVTAMGMDPSSWGLGPGGSIGGRAHFEGPDFDRGIIAFEMGDGSWGEVRHHPFLARLHFAPDLLRLEPCSVETSAGRARVSGSLRDGETLDAEAEFTVPDLALLEPFTGRADVKGSLEGKVTLSGPVSHPGLRGRATVARASMGGLAASAATASGSLDLPGKAADLKFSWTDLVAGETPLGDGSATMAGPFADSKVHLDASAGEDRRLEIDARGKLGLDAGDLRLTRGRVGVEGRTFEQEGEARLAWDDTAVTCSSLALRRKDASLVLSVRMGLGAPDPPLTGSLTAHHIPLRLFPIPPTAGVLAGFIEADLAWSGTLEHPSITGSGSLEEGSYRFPRSDLTIAPIVLKVRARGDRLIVTEATATTAEGGKATGSGSVRFRGYLPETFDLKAVGRDFPFLLGRDVQGRCDFEAAFLGTPEHPILNGTARVLRGRIQLPEVMKQQPLPSTIRFVNGSPEHTAPPVVESAGPGRLGGLIKLESDGKLWVSNRSLLAELAGSVDIAFTPMGPTVAGRLEVVEGRYLFRGRKFDLHDSRIFFGGTTDLTPTLDIRAGYDSGDVEITVHLTGPPEKPVLGLSSSPPLPREDILSLLLFGTKSSDLSSLQRQTQDTSAAALAQQYGTIPLGGPLGDSFGLDSVEVGTSTVGFSKYVGDRLVVEYRQIFGALPEQRLNLRYRINRSWSFETQISDAGKSGADILWERRY